MFERLLIMDGFKIIHHSDNFGDVTITCDVCGKVVESGLVNLINHFKQCNPGVLENRVQALGKYFEKQPTDQNIKNFADKIDEVGIDQALKDEDL